MKRKLSKHQSATAGTGAFLGQLCEGLDRSIPGLRTTILIAGVVAAAAQTGQSADFLFAAGLLFHFAIWFEDRWIAQRTH
jgi:hypothetical protein